uniref:THD domain-containing protein n=1 Tax=Cyprinus carpio carpio TaxID=630221 RepID=A0A9J8A5I1_CYPCA
MEVANEEAASKVYAVLMEPESETVNRLRTKYQSLRRQVCLIQSISVFLCFSCCLFTLLYHAFPQTCTENGTKETSKFGKFIIYYFFCFCIHTSPFSLVKNDVNFTKDGFVPWMDTPEYSSPSHTRYFILEEDNESLKVLHDGTYKVSLQITYRKLSEKPEKDEIFLQHDIRLDTDGYPHPLPLLTHCETVNITHWRKSLFSEGIFYFNSGDRLKVWSNNLILIDVGEKYVQKTVFVVYPHFTP